MQHEVRSLDGSRSQDTSSRTVNSTVADSYEPISAVLAPDLESDELAPVYIYPRVEFEDVRNPAGCETAVAQDLERTEPPTDDELEKLRAFADAVPPAGYITALDAPA